MLMIIIFDFLLILLAIFFIWLAKKDIIEFSDVNDIKRIFHVFHRNPPYYRNRYGTKRIKLLNKNSEYLQKYEDIWKEQLLLKSDLEIELKIKTIYIRDKTRIFKFKINNQNSIDNIWDIMLDKFQESNYDSLLKSIKETTIWEWSGIKYEENIVQKVDINNCSEKDLSDLPCISLIIAKKLVKHRQEIKGFKNKEEFFEYLALKPNIINILSDRIIIKKIKLPKRIKLTKERKIDL